MANKELTARVKLDTKNAEQRLKNLAKAIDTINNAVNKQSSVYDAVNKALGETASKVNRVKQQTDRVKQSATEAGRSFNQIDNGVLKVSRSLDRVSVKLLNWSNRVPIIGNALDGIGRKFASISGRLHNLVSNSNRWSKVSNTLSTAFNKINGVKQQISQKVSGIVSKVHSWASAQSKVHSSTKNTNNLLSNTWNKLKGIAATYLGIIGTKAVINTSDTITSAENRLNSIEGGNPTATAETMDKIYQAANRARTSYTDMLAGASKSMTIAGDAFQGNIDNAIRFEEIMSKSFTVAGASADEMRNSMYQLRQALGSGILQGDELKAVMEQAPLMYDEIENFVQGVLDSEESLKELASQGLVTSDMVVAAVMQAGDKIDKKFEETAMTFAQAWDIIKNSAVEAFTPVLQKLNDLLNSDIGQAIVNGIGVALQKVAIMVLWLANQLSAFFSWCAENWNWLKYIMIFASTIVMLAILRLVAISVWGAIVSAAKWMLVHWQFVLIIIVIGLLVATLVWLANVASSGAEFICMAILAIAIVVGIVALITQSVVLAVVFLIISLVAALVIAIANYGEQIMGFVYKAGAYIYNIVMDVLNGMLTQLWSLVEPFTGFIEWLVNAFTGGFDGILGAFKNLIGQMLSGLLSVFKPIAGLIDKFTDFNITGTIEQWQSGFKSWGKTESAWTIEAKAPTVQSITGALGLDVPESLDVQAAGEAGSALGRKWQNAISDFGSTVQNKVAGIGDIGSMFSKFTAPDAPGDLSDLDKVANILGDKNVADYLQQNDPDAFKKLLDQANGDLGGGYDPTAVDDDIANALDKLGGDTSNISGNTDAIADSMELTEDDLEMFRKLAEMEWKKEFTTATITVDMSNYNTINGEQDVDGILAVLHDRLYEEMDYLANGVYA